MAAYNRGDYMPAIRLFRPLAEQGNPKAQSVIGVMYRNGEAVPRNLAHAFMWFSLAAKRGDVAAKMELHEVSKTMTPVEMSQAESMMQTCGSLRLSQLRVLIRAGRSTRDQALARMTCAWILAATSPEPCRCAITAAA
jgi:TPR repeat protein